MGPLMTWVFLVLFSITNVLLDFTYLASIFRL